MSKATDPVMAGIRYGRWVVLAQAGPMHWLCRCDCGTERSVEGRSLSRGRSRSCGCVSGIPKIIGFPSTDAERFEEKYIPEPNSGCWLWIGGCDSWGYGNITVNGRLVSAHRASWLLHRKEDPGAFWVLHRCDNPPCVNPEHLFLGDAIANARDRAAKGRNGDQTKRQRSDKHPAKLTEDQVREIRGSSLSQKQLGQLYGISPTGAGKARSGKTWRHIT